MAKFEGKWESVPAKTENFDKFAAVTGLPTAMIDAHRKDKFTIEFKIDRDTWAYSYFSELNPKPISHRTKFGEEIEGKDQFDKIFKLTITKVSESEVREVMKSELTNFKPIKTTRTLEPNGEMKAVMEMEDNSGNTVSVKYFFKRI